MVSQIDKPNRKCTSGITRNPVTFKVSEETTNSSEPPRIKDFRGLSNKGFDKYGNYSFGVKEHIIFPEVNFDKVDKVRGLDISIIIKNQKIEDSYELLKKFNFPFKEEKAN